MLMALLVLQLSTAKAQSQAQVQSADTRYHKTAKFGNMIIQDNNQLTLNEKPHSFALPLKFLAIGKDSSDLAAFSMNQ